MAARHDLLAGLADHHACGFHTTRWAADFAASCAAAAVEPPVVFVAPLGPDPDDLAATVASPTDPAAAEAEGEGDEVPHGGGAR